MRYAAPVMAAGIIPLTAASAAIAAPTGPAAAPAAAVASASGAIVAPPCPAHWNRHWGKGPVCTPQDWDQDQDLILGTANWRHHRGAYADRPQDPGSGLMPCPADWNPRWGTGPVCTP